MTRQRLVDKMVSCSEGIITVTMPLNCRTGEQASFSFPGSEEAVIGVKNALYDFVTTLYDDLFGRIEMSLKMVPFDPSYKIRPVGRRDGGDAICPDVDTFLGDNLLFKPNGGCGSSSESETD